MALSDYVLYQMARRWPSPQAVRVSQRGGTPGTDAYNTAYAQEQFDRKVRSGLSVSVTGLDVLEVGCGHGGISCFLAAVGAKRVVGVDLNRTNLGFARKFAEGLGERRGARLPVSFAEMDIRQMGFADKSFDLVFADNLFEHVMDPEALLRECNRVLREGGRVLVPVFSSIYSKFGLHLKHGLKMPWANVVFSERTVLRAMKRLAADDPRLYEWYPGLSADPQRVRDVRRHGDLNDITYPVFKDLVKKTGFDFVWFRPNQTRAGKIARRVPGLRNSILMDVFSVGAGALIRKRG